MSQPAAHDFSTIEPEILDEDMRPGDIVFVLEASALRPQRPRHAKNRSPSARLSCRRPAPPPCRSRATGAPADTP
jgi:hypothetical protein